MVWLLEGQEPNDAVLQLKEGETVTSARLLPLQLLLLDADAFTTDGKLLVVAGSELVRAGSDLFVACTITSLAVGPLESFFVNTEKFGCFIDDDRDGTFDRFFTRGGSNVGILPNAEKIPKTTIPVRPVRYAVADRTKSKTAPTLVCKYSNYAFISKWILFQACIKPGDWRCLDLVDTYGLRQREVPGSFTAYGGLFELMEKNEAGVKVRMLRPFESKIMTFSY